MTLNWEKIKNSGIFGVADSHRAKVVGGWLVQIWSGAVTFVPDPTHQWDGNS